MLLGASHTNLIPQAQMVSNIPELSIICIDNLIYVTIFKKEINKITLTSSSYKCFNLYLVITSSLHFSKGHKAHTVNRLRSFPVFHSFCSVLHRIAIHRIAVVYQTKGPCSLIILSPTVAKVYVLRKARKPSA